MNDDNRYLVTTADTRPGWRERLQSRPVLVIIALIIALALIAWWLKPAATTRAAGGRFAGGGPMPVVAASAHAGDMPITLIGLGTVTPLATVTVQSQIAGQIMHISFKEGQTVKA